MSHSSRRRVCTKLHRSHHSMGPTLALPLPQLRSDSDDADVPAPFTSCGHFSLRWFTPTTEVPLCGHATLAAAAVLFKGAGMARVTSACGSFIAFPHCARIGRRSFWPHKCNAPYQYIRAWRLVQRHALVSLKMLRCCHLELLVHSPSSLSGSEHGNVFTLLTLAPSSPSGSEHGNVFSVVRFHTLSGVLEVTKGLEMGLPLASPSDPVPEGCGDPDGPLAMACTGGLEVRRPHAYALTI